MMTMGDLLLEATLGATVEHLKETRSAIKAVLDGIDKKIEEVERTLAEERRRNASRS